MDNNVEKIEAFAVVMRAFISDAFEFVKKTSVPGAGVLYALTHHQNRHAPMAAPPVVSGSWREVGILAASWRSIFACKPKGHEVGAVVLSRELFVAVFGVASDDGSPKRTMLPLSRERRESNV